MDTRNFNSTEPSAATQSAQAMHNAIKAFLETYFASYLRLGEIDLAGICQLYLDRTVEELPTMGYSGDVGPSSSPPGN